jgi:acetyl esterase/lipase
MSTKDDAKASLVSSHSVVLQYSSSDNKEDTNPNCNIPTHRCSCIKCLCWPCIIQLSIFKLICSYCFCCYKKKHEAWTFPFECAVTILQTAANNISRSWCVLRCFTDPPLGVVPICIGTANVGVVKNVIGPKGGEWFYPATGKKTCCCSCCPGYPGDPQKNNDILQRAKRVVLYFHGGAFALCTSKTHRHLLMKIANDTNSIVYCPNYRRPPEHPWPVPVDDCLECYKWLLQDQNILPSNIVMIGDSAGGGMILSVLGAAKAKKLPMPSGGVLWSKCCAVEYTVAVDYDESHLTFLSPFSPPPPSFPPSPSHTGPWVDLSDSFNGTWTSNQKYDFLPRDIAYQIALSYADNDVRRLPLVSPTNVNFDDFPPLQISVGGSECLHDQVVELVNKLRLNGINIETYVDIGMVHVYPLFHTFSKMDAPPNLAFQRLSAFMDRVMSTGNYLNSGDGSSSSSSKMETGGDIETGGGGGGNNKDDDDDETVALAAGVEKV